jgi:WD40 repeat protein
MTKAMKHSYRYPGLQPFEATDAALFYGRERESRDLYAQVMVEKLVVLFAKSGMGKSSLINAGLNPLLEKTNLLHLRVRLSNVAVPLKEQFLQEIERDEYRSAVTLDPALRQADASLWEQMKAATFTKNGAPATPLFVLDQFEEVFTLYTPALRQTFQTELAELANGAPPEAYLERLRAQIEAGEQLDVPALESSPRCKFIFAIRSDLLHLLNALSPLIPDIMRSRFELLPFAREQAEEAITLPAMLRDPRYSFVSRPFRYDDAALDTLINYLSKNGTEDVESFQLQILCQYIERLMTGEAVEAPDGQAIQVESSKRKSSVVTPALFGYEEGLKSILRNFYTDQIAALPPEKQPVARKIIEEDLITESERRRSVAEDDLLHVCNDRSLLDQLVETRLLRKEPRLKTFYYEISHDTLVPPILVKYKERRQEEERQEAMERMRQEQAEREAQLALERKKRMRALQITLYSLALAVISIIAMFYAFRQRNIAERDKRIAYANDLAYKSQIALRDGDRSAAFRLAEFAQQYVDADNSNALRALSEAFYYNEHPDTTNHRLPWNADFEGHNASVWAVAFSPDGKKLATASEDNTAKVWDIGAGKNILTLNGHTASVESIAFSPDGKRLATASEDSTAVIWDLATGRPVMQLKGHENSVSCIAFSPDGKSIATGSHDRFLIIWDAQTGKPVSKIEAHDNAVLSVAFSPDGTKLATGSYDEKAKVWDVATGTAIEVFEGHHNVVYCVAFSPDNNFLATGSGDKTAKVWNLKTREAQTFDGHNGFISSVAFSPDGKYLATGSYDNTAKLWDLASGDLRLNMKGHSNYVSSVAFSPDGKELATGSVDNTAKVWSLRSDQEALTLTGHDGAVRCVAFSPDGKKLASAADDGTEKVWNLETGKPALVLEGHEQPVLSTVFSHDGKQVATASEDSTARIWNAETGVLILTLRGHLDYVNSVAFSPDGKSLASSSDDGSIKVWNLETGKATLTLGAPETIFSGVAFSPDGKWLAAGSDGGTVFLWNLQTGKAPREFEGHSGPISCVAFSSDCKRLASGSKDKMVKIWDMESGKTACTLAGHNSPVSSVAFSPDGKKLVSGSDDKTAKIWDLETFEAVITLEGHSKSVKGVAFSPDGKQVATGAYEGVVKVWDIDAETIIRKMKSERRLTTLARPQLDLWGLKDLLSIRSGNEERLRNSGEPYQIAAFADLFAQRIRKDQENARSSPDRSIAIRLYESALQSGGDSTLIQQLRALKALK